MLKKLRGARFSRLAVAIPLLVSLAVPLFPSLTKEASATGFNINSGSYPGTGATKAISGLGFQPQMILIKSNSGSSTGGAIKTKDMPGSIIMPMGAAAQSATGITITSDGFTLDSNARVNNLGDFFSYTAISGSDCSVSGTVCISTYSGDGTGARTIATGLDPALVINKSNQAVGSHFKTSSMPAANTEFFSSTAADTVSAYIGALSSSGFNVGAQDNLSGSTYYYAAFKQDTSSFAVGSFTGDGTDNRDISGTSFTPNMVLVKNATSATANNRRSVWTNPDQYGDMSSYIADASTPSVPNFIQSLNSNGFQVGSGAINESGVTSYWFALGGTMPSRSGSGTYKMAKGSYTGSGAIRSITGLSFQPDLVIIKDTSTNASVFRTAISTTDSTSYMGTSTGDFAGGITSLDSTGFTLGTNAAVNTASSTYYWQAFGNAFNPWTNSGAADFAIGAYTGNGADNRNINRQPFSPDMVYVKRNGAIGALRTSSQVGDLTTNLGAGADTSNSIQALNSDGFQLGTAVDSNSSGTGYRWFAFKEGSSFDVGSYTGNATDNRTITAPGFQPELVWVKQSTAVAAVQKPSNLAGDSSQYFTAAANVSGRIKSIDPTGFTIGTASEVNTNSGTYRYFAWRDPPTGSLGVNVVDSVGSTVASPSFSMTSSGFQFDCSTNTGSLGSSSQRIRVTNTTASPGWTLTAAATSGATTLWQNGGSTQNYDFNDTTSSGCSDGADADSKAGRMTIDASAGTLSPQSGCSNSNVSKGSSADFNQGTIDSITLVSASSSAQTNCYWELTGADLGQTIPTQQTPDSYTINLTVTLTAS